MGKRLYFGFHGNEQADLGLASLDNVHGFCGTGPTPSYLVVCLRVIGTGKQWP